MDPHVNPSTGVWDDNYFASKQSGSGGGGSNGSSPAQFPDLKLADLGGSAVDFAKGLNDQENSVFADYAKKVAEQPKPLDLYNTLEENAGIPGLKKSQATLQGQIYDLEDTLRRLEPDINARTQNSLVTEAQRRGMVTAARAPIQENLGWLGQSLGRVSSAVESAKSDITNKVNLAMEGFRNDLEPYKEKLTLAQNQAARMMTGFTADRQSTLDILIQKINRGLAVSDMEWKQAQDLAREERDYIRTQEQLKTQMNQPENQIVKTNGRNLLINMKTGKVVVDLGSTSEAGGGSVDVSKYYQVPSVGGNSSAIRQSIVPSYFTPD